MDRKWNGRGKLTVRMAIWIALGYEYTFVRPSEAFKYKA